MLNVAIIGGGPAAFAAAISIAKHCPASEVTVNVYEARGSLKEHVGVQYTLMYMGLNALDVLGIRRKILELIGHVNSPVWFIDQVRGESRKMDFGDEKGKEGWVHFERVALLEALAAELPVLNVKMHFLKRFASYDMAARRVTFADGTSAPADLLIGADGIHSTVRAMIDPSIKPIVPGNEGFYMTMDFSDIAAKSKESRTAQEQSILDFVNGNASVFSWAIPEMFGLFPLGNNRLCFFDSIDHEAQKTLFNGKTQDQAGPEEKRKGLLARAKAHRADLGPHPCPAIDLLPTLVEMVDFSAGEKKDHWVIKHLPLLEKTAYERIVIIGDAAHAVPPSSGYGAQSSIEDGAFLGLALRDRYFSSSGMSLQEVLHEFSDTRKLVIHPIHRISIYSNAAYIRKSPKEKLPVSLRPPAGSLDGMAWLGEVMLGSLMGVDGVKDVIAIPGSPGMPVPEKMRIYTPGKI
ncbi:hypothetical protein BJ742DRAFT_49262 [Cladochytrium replicatum]|nr:hypothetical protein BJ742DRAFT_49262 [Cladochytrium replicatum]